VYGVLSQGGKKEIFFFQNFYKQGTHPWFNSFKFRRRSIVSINRLRSGHTSLKDSLKKT
jgi:hypothetical protein